jgi:hypothetical protein
MAGPGVTRDGNFFSLIGIAEDWTAEQIFGPASLMPDMKIKRIELRGGADAKGSTSRVVIRQGGTDGATICTLACASPYVPDRVVFDEPQYLDPFLDFADSLLPFTIVDHKLIFEIE